ncbi:V-type ATP synthase subunit E [Estrella lausannensis]|uniref:V-type ATP synthase, subunit E n=1 Tax=Estrella lausannensis TaxID=483423 RepID=A0A0H5DPS0_9BACT|nr:V-type ATP synthase subunit E [Estrella lausannensis]CRX38018.1 V-type ATP synthase, subunit E [Estrella lausannensis]
MKQMEKGQDKIQKICDVLRKETLEPAHREAERLVEEAKERAKKVIGEAEEEAALMIKKAKEEIAREKNVFQASLGQAAKQTMETLRQQIETELFNPEIEQAIHEQMAKPEIIANLIKAVVHAIEKEGLGANLEAVIPKAVPPKQVAALLGEEVLKKVKGHELTIGGFAGGAKIKMGQKNMMIDISDSALKELISSFVRKDFRDLLFQGKAR